VSLGISCTKRGRGIFPIIVIFSITNNSKWFAAVILSRSCSSKITDEVHCLRSYLSARCRRSLAFTNVGLGRLTGLRHAISILDLREVWRDEVSHVIARKSVGVNWTWFLRVRCNIQIRQLQLILRDMSRDGIYFCAIYYQIYLFDSVIVFVWFVWCFWAYFLLLSIIYYLFRIEFIDRRINF